MKQKLEELANQVEQEILTTGMLQVGGVYFRQNSLNKTNPYAGLCHAAVEKLRELAPELNLRGLAFRFQASSSPDFLSNHHQHALALAEITCSAGQIDLYEIDVTIRQYLPEAQLVYGPEDVYPLKIHPHSLRLF